MIEGYTSPFHEFTVAELAAAPAFDLSLLKTLVESPSPTEHFDLVTNIQEIVEWELNRLGFSSYWVQNPDKLSAPLLFARKESSKAQINQKVVTLVFHADTVSSLDWNHQMVSDDVNNRLLSPGIADNKGGIAMAICALRAFLANLSEQKITLQVVSCPNEETGSRGFHQTLKQIGLGSNIILGFEPALNGGDVITSRSGNAWYHIHTKGLSAHSGRMDPHVNAAHEMSLKISKFLQLNQIERGMRANIGCLTTKNDRFNIVCGEIEAKLDLRFKTRRQQKNLCSKVEEILKDSLLECPFTETRCETSWTVADLCPPMEDRIGNHYLKKIFAGENHHHCIESGHSGGAADVNYMDHPNAACLDGLGPIGGGMHTQNEFIKKDELVPRLRRVIDLIHTLNKESL